MSVVTWQGDESAVWETGGNWDTGSAPGAADDAVLSNAAACTIAASTTINSLNCTGYTGTFTHNAAVNITIDGANAGGDSLILVSGMTYTLGNATTSALIFTGSGDVTTGTKTVGNVTFNGASQTWYMLDGMTSSGTLTLTQGTLHTDGASDVSGLTHSWGKFNSSNTNTRVVYFGNSSVTITGTGSDCWLYYTTTNLTHNAGTSTITFTGSLPYCYFGSQTYYNLVSSSAGGGARVMSPFTCTNFTRIGTAIKTDYWQVDANITVNGALTLQGNSSINRLNIISGTLGTARTITLGASATFKTNSTNFDLRDITMTGGAANERDCSALTGGSGDCGGNTGITFTTADDWYWNGSDNPCNFSDYDHWYDTTNGGGTQMASTRCPLPQDTCYINGDSIDGATTIDQDMPRIPGIDFTNSAAVAFHTNNINQTIYGSLTYVDNVTITYGSNTFSFEGRGAYLLTSAGKTWNNGSTIQMVGGSLTVQDDTSFNGTTTLSNGTFDFNNKNLTFYSFNSSNSNLRTLTMGSGNCTLTRASNGDTWDTTTTGVNFTFNKDTSTIIISGSSNLNFKGGGLTFNNITINGTAAADYVTFIGSNAFSTFTINAPKTVKFTAGTTTTVTSFVATGTAVNPIVIDNTTATGSLAATLSDTSGTNTLYYCTIGTTYNVNAAGGATWNALLTDNNTVTNGTGWTTVGGVATLTPLKFNRRRFVIDNVKIFN